MSLLPVAEKPFRRLMMLQNKLVDCMQHRAGLNPRAFRYDVIIDMKLHSPFYD